MRPSRPNEPLGVQATIVAISTPPGRGGIGIVRLSGPDAVAIARELVALRGELEHAQARFARVLDPGDRAQTIDEALVTAFHAPHSYTGEDLVEVAAHGSPVVLAALVDAALDAGRRRGVEVRLAEPGEFTQRAFLGGRLDLTQAEAVHDLIAARTLEQARTAAQQLGGAMSRRVAPAKEQLVQLIALLEAGMDFASGELDDVDVVPPELIARDIVSVRGPLEALAASFRRGRLEREGATVALIGRPNAGKSSLFNRLLERNRSIVTAAPGTTRDTVEETASLEGIPVRLIDTAGLREGDGEEALHEAEVEGIARSREALADAELVLLVHDANEAMTGEERELLGSLAGRPHLVVENKVDLLPDAALGPSADTGKTVRISARTGEGLEALRAVMLKVLSAGAVAEAGALNNRRQQETVLGALEALAAAFAANESGLPHELLLMDLHRALDALDALTGATTTDDILGRIFSTFCIGK
jgi:tRNA modification GTPase